MESRVEKQKEKDNKKRAKIDLILKVLNILALTINIIKSILGLF